MNHLSVEIAKTNNMIANATHAIRECLPSITEQTTAQIKKLEEFAIATRQLKESVEQSLATTNNAGNTHIDMILNLANSALSHLQFQDPMIQSVQKIGFLMSDLHNELNKTLDIPPPSANSDAPYIKTLGNKISDESQQYGSDPKPDAGEVLLF